MASACSIEPGEFTALVGPSGSGKTTTLQLMGCLDKPDSGAILINGEDVTRFNANKRADLRREEIGFIFQFFRAGARAQCLRKRGTAATAQRRRRQRAQRDRVDAMLDAVGLADRANHRPDQLSGGQQQRVAIARALATDPALVLADEPTANLDTANGEQAMDIMQKLNQETGTAFIFATHDPRVMTYASRTIQMVDGKIVDNGNRQRRSCLRRDG